LVVYYDLVKGL